MSFPNGLVPTAERVHPTPLYEFIVACAIAWWLWRLGAPGRGGLVHTQSTSPSGARPTTAFLTRPGEVFAAYLVLTGAARYLVEFIRINPRSFLGMSNAQAAAAASVIVGIILWRWTSRRKVAS
jgi:phosphatidylglycerol:prolipoprotein diacylglycerol transferase